MHIYFYDSSQNQIHIRHDSHCTSDPSNSLGIYPLVNIFSNLGVDVSVYV